MAKRLSYEEKKDYIDLTIYRGRTLTDKEFKETPEDLQDYYIESGGELTDSQLNLIKSNSKLVRRYEEVTIKKYKESHSHEWVDILGQGNYSVQEDNSEWDEKAPTPDLFENED